MRCYSKYLDRILGEGNKSRFIIPIYQRQYSWKEDNCQQLWNDILRIIKNKQDNHFLGSIVYSKSYDNIKDKILVDGQQRITTISLLLLAAIRAVYKEEMSKESTDDKDIRLAITKFIIADQLKIEPKNRLVLINGDRIIYESICDICLEKHEDKLDKLSSKSRLVENFIFFYEKIKHSDINFKQLFDALRKITIISIELERDDDAQLIFESLNSTGKNLVESDKICNYLLMSLTEEQQLSYYKSYWREILQLVGKDNSNTRFFQLYIINNSSTKDIICKKDSVYTAWKRCMQERKDNKLKHEDVLKEMKTFAKYYRQVKDTSAIVPKYLKKPSLNEKLAHIVYLQPNITNGFFMLFLEYADSNNLSESEVFRVIDLVECYLIRRAFCDSKNNSQTNLFDALHNSVKTSLNNGRSYSDVLADRLINYAGNDEWPRDEQFKQAIIEQALNNKNKRALKLAIDFLENYSYPEEPNNVIELLEDKYKLDNIMPEKLNDNWKAMLGANYKEIHKKYLHTLANLVLVPIDDDCSDADFDIKCGKRNADDQRLNQGYLHSKLRNTREVSTYQQWTASELEQRANWAANTLLKLFPSIDVKHFDSKTQFF